MLPVLPLLLAQVGSGRITGGWGYVYLAYGVTVLTLALYATSLLIRYRGDKKPPGGNP